MPGFIACKLCPGLIFVPVDFKKYTYYSDLTRKGQALTCIIVYIGRLSIVQYVIQEHMCLLLVFQTYDPNFIAASLDEAYLDITEVCKERGVSVGEVWHSCIH